MAPEWHTHRVRETCSVTISSDELLSKNSNRPRLWIPTFIHASIFLYVLLACLLSVCSFMIEAHFRLSTSAFLVKAETIISTPHPRRLTSKSSGQTPRARSCGHQSAQGFVMDLTRGGQTNPGVSSSQLLPSGSSLTPLNTESMIANEEGSNDDSFAAYTLPNPVLSDDNEAEHVLHETVQDRVDSWRQAQLAQSSRLQHSPRDDQGRIKLLTGVSRGSRAIIFICLVFRNLHLFEVADQTLSGSTRLLVVIPLIGLFVANLAGAVASFTAPTHSAKKRLKAILNLDKLLEMCLILWNLFRLTVAPSKYVPREIFVSSTLHSIFFILQCQAFTRLTWDESSAATPSAMKDAAISQSPSSIHQSSLKYASMRNLAPDGRHFGEDRHMNDSNGRGQLYPGPA